jgi:hypothetical protein
VGCFDDRIGHEIKTTRIWKETRGRATATDRVIILSDAVPMFDLVGLTAALEMAVDEQHGFQNIDASILEQGADELAGT